ncbi:MAG: hypothetical protein ACJAT1_001013 [Marivirga sp.]|jgi:hypothetical protein
MVKIKKELLSYAPIALAALTFYGCKDDDSKEVSKKDLLIGEWNLVEIDGDSYEADPEYDYTYSISFNFQGDGDFEYCNSYESKIDPTKNYSGCYDGGAWVLVEDKITVTNTTESNGIVETEEFYIDISSITSDRLEGDLSYEGDSDTYSVVFEKEN